MGASCADPGGVAGGPDHPLKNHKFIGFPSNIGPDPLKITKLPSQHQCGSLSASQRNTISMAFRWQANNCLLLVVFGASLPLEKLTRVGPPLTKLSGSVHGCKPGIEYPEGILFLVHVRACVLVFVCVHVCA